LECLEKSRLSCHDPFFIMSIKPIAIICLSPSQGGMELLALSFAKKLNHCLTDSKVIMIVKQESYIHSELKTSEDLAYEVLGFRTFFSFSIMKNVRKIVKYHNIKNIIFFGNSEMKSMYFSFLYLRMNLSLVHVTTKSTSKKDFLHRVIYSDVKYYIGLSTHLVNNVKEIFPLGSQTQLKMITPSLDINPPLVINHSKLTLLHTGRITKGKGQVDAIKACKSLIKNNIDFHFYIVGQIEPSFEVEFMNFYENCKYKDKIELTGFKKDISTYIQKSDVFIFPSYGEGFGLSFAEALANNIVCLSYANTSFFDFEKFGFYFRMCKDGDISDLGKNLLDVCMNLEFELEKSNKNHALAKKVFSTQREIDKYLEILE